MIMVNINENRASRLTQIREEIEKLKTHVQAKGNPSYLFEYDIKKIVELEFELKALQEGLDYNQYAPKVVIPWTTKLGWNKIPQTPLSREEFRRIAELTPDQIVMPYYMISTGHVTSKIVEDPHVKVVWTKIPYKSIE